jgi:2-polyprenyl-3-methyl-5-hydroxy-6-metoxy-1,4-benzoquinol methylase
MACEAEIPGRMLTLEQLQMVYYRYYTAGKFVRGKQVLEVGCGAGIGLGYLAKRAKKVIGTDYSEDNLRYAQQHYKGKIELLLQDAHNLAFKDNSFDVIVVMEVIFYLRHVGKFLDECHRVLKKEGTLIICLPNKDVPGFRRSKLSHRYYSVPELSALLDQHRFEAELFGAFPISKGSGATRRIQTTVLNGINEIFDRVPKGSEAKKLINKFILHKTALKGGIKDGDMKILEDIRLVPLPRNSPDFRHKILYAIAHARS